jgi:hypothetical protein
MGEVPVEVTRVELAVGELACALGEVIPAEDVLVELTTREKLIVHVIVVTPRVMKTLITVLNMWFYQCDR